MLFNNNVIKPYITASEMMNALGQEMFLKAMTICEEDSLPNKRLVKEIVDPSHAHLQNVLDRHIEPAYFAYIIEYYYLLSKKD